MTTTPAPTDPQPVAAETCAPEPHVWVANMRGGEPVHVEICMGCGQFNWDGLREQVAVLVDAELAKVRAELVEIKAAVVELAPASLMPEHLRGDGPCQDCGTPDNIRWFAPSVVWNHVMGGTQATDDPGGIVCVPCFIKRVDAAGFAPTVWQITPNWFATGKAEANPATAAEPAQVCVHTHCQLDQHETVNVAEATAPITVTHGGLVPAPDTTAEPAHTVWDHYGPCGYCGAQAGPCLNVDNSDWPTERMVPAPKPHPRRQLADATAEPADEPKATCGSQYWGGLRQPGDRPILCTLSPHEESDHEEPETESFWSREPNQWGYVAIGDPRIVRRAEPAAS